MSVFIASHKKALEQDSRFGFRKKSGEPQNPGGQALSRSPHVAGNLATERLLRSAESPSKVTISPPGNVHEQEADKLAEQAMQAPEETPQRKAGPVTATPESSVPDSHSLGSGHPLDAASRAFFEPRFGVDLSHVRVHTDAQAAASADAVDAEAYTVGSNIVFGADHYRPTTHDGKSLLGHELAHVMQQSPRSQNPHPSTRVRIHTGTATIIQRQPGPGTHTDPVAFIENQLRVRFTDPDDPRLIVRVQRLQEAFGLLTIAEARRLLDRLREPGDELAKNFQRLATPSRNRLRAILLRGLPAEIEGKVLGWVSFAAAPTIQIPLVATIEVTPSTEEAGLFAGYSDFGEARAAAVRRATVSAIVLDKKLGRQRVFETGFPTIRGVPGLRVAASEGGLDYQLVDWVNLEGPELPSQQDRGARIGKAKKMRDDFYKTHGSSFVLPGGVGPKTSDPQKDAARKEVENAYVALFEEAVPFAQGQFHFSFEFDAKGTQGESRLLTTANPTLINVDLTDIYAHGRQKMLDPMEDQDFPGTHRRVSIKDALQESSPLPYEAYITLAPGALAEEPLETRRVVLHEESHRAHAQRTIKLIEDWKAQGSVTPFQDWLDNEVKNRRVSSVDAILAKEGVEQKGWAFNTELLAEIEGFIAVYHAIPLGNDWALERLPQMSDMWLNSDPELQELGVRKLHHYYSQILDQSHRDAFDQYVGKRWAEADQASNPQMKARASFYLKLSEFYEIR